MTGNPRSHRHSIASLAATLALTAGQLGAQILPDSLVDQTAPDTFVVSFQTTRGDFVVKAHRDWSPLGVDRFYHLVRLHVFDGVAIYRVTRQFAQFGLTNDPQTNAAWSLIPIPDEPVKLSNTRGRIHFARAGPGSRSHQLSIMRVDNTYLDSTEFGGVVGFPPIAEVVEGIDVIDALNGTYGDEPLSQYDSIRAKGREYLDRVYPGLDAILSARLVEIQLVPETGADSLRVRAQGE